MKKVPILIYFIALLFIINLLIQKHDTAYAAAPKIIKFATLAPQGSTWLNVVNDVSEELKEKSDGKLRLKIYAGGVAGDEKDVLRKMRIKQIHCAGFTGVGLGEILNEVRVFDLPFVFKAYDEIDFVRNALNERFEKGFEKNGYILLGWTDVGFVYFFSNIMIDSMDALRSTKMWIWEGDPVAKALFDAIKLRPVPLSITDVMTSLQTGLINSVYVSPLGAVALQWFTKVKYMLDVPLANAVGAILISKKVYNSMEPDMQTLLKSTFKKHMERLTKMTREDNKGSIEEIKKYGVEVISLDSKSAVEFDQVSKTVSDSVSGTVFPAELIDSVNTNIKEYRNLK